jgi:tetratricopeptide (TPR) repeat protein
MGHIGRLATLTAALLVLAGAAAFISALRSFGGPDDQDASRVAAVESPSDQAIARLQLLAESSPQNIEALAELGFAYLQKARESGDPAFYSKADDVFQKALNLDPADPSGLLGASAVALARHDFQQALGWAQRAHEAAPGDPDAYGALGDAQVELGQYEDALDAYQHMLNIRPDLNAYVRAAYARELHGDSGGAIETMLQAIEASRPFGETAAWVRTQLANLYFNTGDIKEAEAQYAASLETFPGYVHALAGLARVAAANGDYGEAIDLYDRVVTRQPVLEYVAALGDVYHAAGRDAEAQRQYGLVTAIESIYRENAINTDLEMALFLADHPATAGPTEEAIEQARAVYATQPGNIRANDVLSWALYRAGRFEEASVYSQQAVRLGTQDPLLLFHAGMINYQLGNNAIARDYLERMQDSNPHFSVLHEEAAKDALAELKASVHR